MEHQLKGFMRKVVSAAQNVANISEEKAQEFLEKSDKLIDKTAAALENFEKDTQNIENQLITRTKNAKEAFLKKREEDEKTPDSPKNTKDTTKSKKPS